MSAPEARHCAGGVVHVSEAVARVVTVDRETGRRVEIVRAAKGRGRKA